MSKRTKIWAGRIGLILAISVAMIGPALVVHAQLGPSRAPVASSAAKSAVAPAVAAVGTATTLQPLSTTKYVYITRTGSKYHRAGCRYLRKSKIKKTLKWAKSHHYKPCKVCKPPTK